MSVIDVNHAFFNYYLNEKEESPTVKRHVCTILRRYFTEIIFIKERLPIIKSNHVPKFGLFFEKVVDTCIVNVTTENALIDSSLK